MKRSTKRKIIRANPWIFAAGWALVLVGGWIDFPWIIYIGALVVTWPIGFIILTYPRDPPPD